jgi:hypothetical protein
MSHWCDFCQDNFEASHFDEMSHHRVGPQWGPEGLTMWKIREIHRLVTGASEPADWRVSLLAILNTREAAHADPCETLS